VVIEELPIHTLDDDAEIDKELNDENLYLDIVEK
jgi:hypothetical protein